MIHFSDLRRDTSHLPLSAYLGFIPDFFSKESPLHAAEQLNANYAHGGGWRPMEGWTFNPSTLQLSYGKEREKEVYSPVALGLLRDEKILVYPHAWVCIVQSSGSFEVGRVD